MMVMLRMETKRNEHEKQREKEKKKCRESKINFKKVKPNQ